MNDLIQTIIIGSIITFFGVPAINFIYKAFWHKRYLEDIKREENYDKLQRELREREKRMEEDDEY